MKINEVVGMIMLILMGGVILLLPYFIYKWFDTEYPPIKWIRECFREFFEGVFANEKTFFGFAFTVVIVLIIAFLLYI